MMSLVAEVLVTAGKLEKVDLDEKIGEIRKNITKLKNDVKDYINDNYIEFGPTLKKNQALLVKAELLAKDMESLQNRVRDQIKVELSGSTRELKNLSNALRESSLSLQLSSQLLELDESLKKIKTYKREKRYVAAARTLRRMNEILDTPHNDLQLLDIHATLSREYSSCRAMFINDVVALWDDYVCWSESRGNGKEFARLTIECDEEKIQDLTEALHSVGGLISSLSGFSSKLMNSIVAPIVDYECSVSVDDGTIFTVEYGDKKKKPGFESVLYNVRLLFKFLHQHLNLTVGDDENLIVLLSGYLLEPLAEKLIRDCIADTIPSSSLQLQNFETVVSVIDEFQDHLLEIGFIKEDQRFLSEYTKNVDTLFIDKICQGLLARASQITKKDLHDSFRHEPNEPVELSAELLDGYDYKFDRKLSKHTFQLPPCQISKSARETLNLAREILEEACSSSNVCAVRLFYTSRNVFEIYANTVPEHHKKFLETLPQQVALFHNNCMYLAHHLLTLAYEYRERLPSHLLKHNVTYTDLTMVLRTVGAECFLDHMKYQRNIIIDILRDSGLSQLGQAPELPQSTERALRQCIRQLELLKTVWLDVLPVNIYCRAVGCITNSMVEDLVNKVITVEDIPADVATDLVTLFGVIVKRTPSIFPDPTSIQRHVSKWSRLKELIKVLEASLKEIEDRWAHGKGPLAHEFTASQVKQLIRALFQNTERRSTVLANIE